MDVRVNMGDTIDPFQLANGFETVIGYEYQERSNPPLFHLDDTNKSCKGVTKHVSGWGGVYSAGEVSW